MGGPATSFAADPLPPRPNVVLIFMDDMGYADIGPFGSAVPTPNLDQLAADGRRFTDFVVSSAVCSASRAALMTGCYHRRVGISGAFGPGSDTGLDPDETTVAEICKSAGYRTACYGKWHLGRSEAFLPHHQGFDEFYGYPYSNDMWPLHPDTIRRQKINPSDPGNWPPLPILHGVAGRDVEIINDNVMPEDQKRMTGELTRRAVEFIAKKSDEPFFLYLPHPMVHVPLYCSDEFAGKSGAGLFGDVIMEIDHSVGQIVDAIDAAGQTDNTLVIFSSDNGPWLAYGSHAGSAAPLREGKGTMFEGGYREPTLMKWPGVIPAGTSTDTLCSSIDVLPTIASIIGAELPSRKIDGHSMLGVMTGRDDTPTHEAFFGYYGGGQLQIVRDDRFKLVLPHRYRTLDGRQGRDDGIPIHYKNVDAPQALYNLDADPGETTDVAAEHPEVVKRLMAAAEEFRGMLGDKLTGREGAEVRQPRRAANP